MVAGLLSVGFRLVVLLLRTSGAIRAENLVLRKQLAQYMERDIKPRRVDFALRVSLALATTAPAAETALSEFATRAKARLIRKVYEADPLVCPKCQGPMRVIALIDDPAVVRRILEHLGRWAPEPAGRGPPLEAPDWPRNAVIPITYHPVPDNSGFVRFRRKSHCRRASTGAISFESRDGRR